MMELVDGRLLVGSPMLMGQAHSLLDAGCARLSNKVTTVDLSSVTEVDSSALAVMLGWLRFAQARNFQIHFSGVPANIRSLADLYGLTEVLPFA